MTVSDHHPFLGLSFSYDSVKKWWIGRSKLVWSCLLSRPMYQKEAKLFIVMEDRLLHICIFKLAKPFTEMHHVTSKDQKDPKVKHTAWWHKWTERYLKLITFPATWPVTPCRIQLMHKLCFLECHSKVSSVCWGLILQIKVM